MGVLADKALAIDETDPLALGEASMYQCLLGNHDQSITYAEQALAAAPGMDSPYYTLGWSQMFNDTPLEAIENLKRSMRLSPLVTAPRSTILGSCYRNAGQLQIAVATLKDTVKRFPAFVSGRVALASCYALMGREQEARQEARENTPERPWLQHRSVHDSESLPEQGNDEGPGRLSSQGRHTRVSTVSRRPRHTRILRMHHLRSESHVGSGPGRSMIENPARYALLLSFLMVVIACAPPSDSGSADGAAAEPDSAETDVGGPTGPSPYDVVPAWHKPFAESGYAFGGNSGVFAESPDRIFIAMRGETLLPDPVPEEFDQHPGSLGINVLRDVDRRTWRNCLFTLDGNGDVLELWNQWDHLCEGSEGPGPHRVRISPYDPQRRVWLVNETFHQIYVFSNDGSELLMTLGEKLVPGDDERHFAKPQDVAFLPDGRILVADGLDNHRVVVLDENAEYLGEFGGFGEEPGQFQGIHALGIGPDGLVFALDRSGGRINVFRTTEDPAVFDHTDTWDGLRLPLDIIVNEDSLWITDLGPLRFVKYDFEGNQLYSWEVPRELPDGYLEVHTFSVDSDGNLYGGDNQYGRTQKLVPKPDADPALLIQPPWVAR